MQQLKKVTLGLRSAQEVRPLLTGLAQQTAQLDQACQAVYSAASRGKESNLYNELFGLLSSVYNDQDVQAANNAILSLQTDLADYIAQKGWGDAIRKLGFLADSLTVGEQQSAIQLINQQTLMICQALASRASNKDIDTQLIPLERSLIKKQLELVDSFDMLSPDSRRTLEENNMDIARLTFITTLIQLPQLAATVSNAQLGAFIPPVVTINLD
jgi:hypothetical protein